MITYSLAKRESGQGTRQYVAGSYDCYHGRLCHLYADGCGWTKQPLRWKTREGAEGYRAKRDWLCNFDVVETPYTLDEKRMYLAYAAGDLLAALRAILNSGELDGRAPEVLVHNAQEAVAKAEGRR